MLDAFVGHIAERSAEDILGGRIRIRIGDVPYVLPVRSIAANERWLATLDSDRVGLLDAVTQAGDDTAEIYRTLAGATDQLLDLLTSYDETGVLPGDLKEHIRPHELLFAVLEVWRAANPLVDVAIEGLRAGGDLTASPPPSEPMSSSPRPTAGRRRKSAPN